jgi:hypothetical protein
LKLRGVCIPALNLRFKDQEGQGQQATDRHGNLQEQNQ